MSVVAGPIDSLWSRSTGTAPFDAPALEGDVTADVAIVGGGFTGLSTALHLAEAGREAVVLEAETIGFGASGRNGGQVNPGLKLDEPALVGRFGEEAGRRFHRLGQEAPQFLADLVARLDLDCRMEHRGLLRLAHNAAAMRVMRSNLDALERAGVAVQRLPDRDAVEAYAGTRAYPGGAVDPRGRSVHPLDLSRELARAAQKAGTRIFSGSRVVRLREASGGWRVETDGGAVAARQVVVATNGYTDGLVPGLARSLLPVNSFQVATEPLPEELGARILPHGNAAYDSRRLILYFRKTPDGRVALGGRASFSSDPRADIAKADYSILERILTGIFPSLADRKIACRWTGLVCITLDHLPHYHRPAEGLHVVLGFNGRGVALSHRVGAWLARSIAGIADSGAIPPTPIAPIPFHRHRETLLNLAMQWNRVLDMLGR